MYPLISIQQKTIEASGNVDRKYRKCYNKRTIEIHLGFSSILGLHCLIEAKSQVILVYSRYTQQIWIRWTMMWNFLR